MMLIYTIKKGNMTSSICGNLNIGTSLLPIIAAYYQLLRSSIARTFIKRGERGTFSTPVLKCLSLLRVLRRIGPTSSQKSFREHLYTQTFRNKYETKSVL